MEYLQGRENVIADALSRVAPLHPEPQNCNTSLNNIEKIPVHQITQIASASSERLQEICEATSKDSALRILANTVHEGWPKTIRNCPRSIQSYWYFRDDITYEEGILYKGVRLIMPQSERASTLKVLHMGHYAIDKMNLRAKEIVYWPGINEDIKVTCYKCEIYAKFERTQQKETLQYVEMPQAGWEQLGLDLFPLRNTCYLIVVDYFSWFPVVRKLQCLHSMSVIRHLKEIFTEIGVPRCIVSDGGTQFTSQEFQDFTRRWDIQHRITSLTNAQSNGQAEWFVQTIKNSLTKWMEGKTHIWQYFHILQYLWTTVYPHQQSYWTLENFRCLLRLWIRQQNHMQQYRNMMQCQKHIQAKHYNKSARDLPSLKTGNAVYIQLVPNVRKWILGIVIERISGRSYKNNDYQRWSLH